MKIRIGNLTLVTQRPTQAPPAPLTAAVELPDGPIAWEGVLVVEGVETGDERFIADGALSWDELPLPLTVDHDGTVGMIIGRIDSIERDGSTIRGTGVLGGLSEGSDNQRVARQVAELIAEGFVRGLSVELDDVEGEIVVEMPTDEDGEPLDPDDPQDEIVIPLGGDMLRVTEARIRAVSVVQNAAFVEAQIRLPDVTVTSDDEPVAAAAGLTPGEVVRTLHAEKQTASETADSGECTDCDGIPTDWFGPPPEGTDPRFIHVDGQRVYGYVAAWGECHSGFADVCTPPPTSAAGYGYYLTGQVEASDGRTVAVGQITMGAGHADLYESDWRRVRAHYDGGPGAVQMADVSVGEDEVGIWFSGALRPGVTEEQVAAMQAQAISGDWRPVVDGEGLELVALAVVPNPGFPKVRARVADGRPVALVATAGHPDRLTELEQRLERLEKQLSAWWVFTDAGSTGASWTINQWISGDPDAAEVTAAIERAELRRACADRGELADQLREV